MDSLLCWICHEYSQTQTSPRSPCHRCCWLDLTSVISSHTSHILSFVAKGRHKSYPVIGEGMNALALLWPNGDAQFMDKNPKSSFDNNEHIFSLCRSKLCQLDGILHLLDTLHLTHPRFIWLSFNCQLSHYLTCMYVEHNVRPIVLGRVCHQMWHILQILSSSTPSLRDARNGWFSWRKNFLQATLYLVWDKQLGYVHVELQAHYFRTFCFEWSSEATSCRKSSSWLVCRKWIRHLTCSPFINS